MPDEPLSSEEMLRLARENAESAPSPPIDDDDEPEPASAATVSADEVEPAPDPTPVIRRPADSIPAPTERRTDVWFPVLVAGLVGLVITAAVVFVLRSSTGESDVEAFISGVETGLSDGMEEMGFDDAAISCVLADVRGSGAYEELDGLDDADLETLVTVSPSAPLSDYPPEFRPIAEATITAMVSCVAPDETTDLTQLSSQPSTQGDDPSLDRLWEGCAANGGESCDLLYLVSPVSSDYERYGSTCGDRTEADGGLCMDLNGPGRRLDEWRGECGAGDFGACDLLYQLSPVDSDDELFGITCGGREEESALSCWARLGPGTG